MKRKSTTQKKEVTMKKTRQIISVDLYLWHVGKSFDMSFKENV